MSEAAPPAPPSEEPGYTVLSDATISFEEANRVALIVLPFGAGLVLLHLALWGGRSVGEGFAFLFPWLFFPVLLVSVVVHEGLHAAGFLAVGRAPRSAVHFGVDRRTLSPYAGCRAALRAGAYRFAILLPSLALALAPAAAGLATGTGWLTLWGAFMLVSGAGDFAALWAMRRVPNTARVLDHPERVGCRVVSA
jgi:putative zincin peptidase